MDPTPRLLSHLTPLILIVAALSACSDSDKTGTTDTGDTTNEVVDTLDAEDTTDTDTGGDTRDTNGDDADAADSADGETPLPGEFGAPCTENKDCNSGWCVSSNLGPLCSRTCVEDCPGGWNCLGVTDQADVTFLCVPGNNRLCQPCTVDTQCGSGYCLERQEGQRCSGSCQTDRDCPNGYECKMTDSEVVTDKRSLQCIPKNDSCECLPGQEGLERPCNNQNESGTCWGLETCLGLPGWSECDAPVPTAEVCDGVDNNCNLFVDEGITAETCEVSNTFGTCAGRRVCQGEAGFTCIAATPAPEACNYQDDDCDGLTDEDFADVASGLYVSDTNCGVCGNDCTGFFPNATSGCVAEAGSARCVVKSCAPGYYQAGPTTCLPVVAAGCLPCTADANCIVPGNVCVPRDGGSACAEDCGPGNLNGRPEGVCAAGYSCEALSDGRHACVPDTGSCACLASSDAGRTRACTETNTFGTCAGSQTCNPDAGGFTECTARVPSAETCNGIDDDCDGLVDEDAPVPTEACVKQNASGSCVGSWRCTGLGGWSCNAQVPAAESCNRQDDDCDGKTDEDFTDQASGLYVADQNCGVCGNDCTGLFPNALSGCISDGNNARCGVLTCDEGYYQASATTCLPVLATGCTPCTADANCVVPGNACVPLDGGSACAEDCGPGNLNGRPEGVCAAGYSCTAIDASRRVCVPDTGSCGCLAAGDTGKSRACTEANAFGTCAGTQTCDPASGGFSACSARVPAAETCNGQDDDCDGLVDEAVSEPTEACERSNASGTCGGSWRCAGQGGWVCSALVPAPETCNGLGDDYDRQTDEDFRDAAGLYTSDAHCGLCNRDCDSVVLFSSATECLVEGGVAVCVATACDDGFFIPPDTNRVCVPTSGASACSPCADDAQCAELSNGRCSTIDGGRFCTAGCGPGGTCDSGYQCEGGRCMPTTASCTCRSGFEGTLRPCVNQNNAGTCTGTQTCDPGASPGWSPCSAKVPATESCNGQDDNCDGRVDEGVSHSPSTCQVQNEFGTCSATYRCEGANAWQCPVSNPQVELCNFQDDNCDGRVDETFRNANGTYVDDRNCGNCGSSCVGLIPNATSQCVDQGSSARCEVKTCNPGYYQAGPLTCLPAVDAACAPCVSDANCPTPGDRCLNLDGGRFCGRDCSATNKHGNPAGACASGYECLALAGGADQCVPTSRSCSCLAGDGGDVRTCQRQNAAGTCYGTESCAPESGWGGCTAATPVAETCNGKDDDCNGRVDEGVSAPADPCQVQNGFGTCSAAWSCGGEAGWVCNAKTPVAEVCNGQDDDCDGQSDEDFKNGSGVYNTLTSCGACGITCVGAIPNASASCQVSGATARCEVASCDAGYYKASATTCLPASSSQCLACSTDANCPTPGDKCLTLDGAKVCGRDCAAGNVYGTPAGQCPAGNVCQDLGEGVRQCVPTSGSCTCLAGDAGKTRSCFSSNVSGTCFGSSTCNPASGWGACDARVPAAETCNTIDDDCNAQIDDVSGRGQSCNISNGFGTCSGIRDCVAGQGALTCVGKTPAAEVCNYLDDDCDGSTDEGYPTLNQSCSNGVGACQRFGFNVCTANGAGVQCNAVAGASSAEICDGLDNNCNGQTDEGAAFAQKGQPCTLGQGVCQVTGVYQCSANGASVTCSQTPPAASVPNEVGLCNNLDDDCDGSIDEDFANKGQVCSVGTGQCRAFGNFVCAGNGASTTCNAVAGAASAESCDLLDNNCDGSTDESFKNAQGKYSLDTTCGNCFTNCTQIYAKPHGYGVCDATPAVPACKLACDVGYFDLNGVPDDGCEFQLDNTAIYVGRDSPGSQGGLCGLGPQGTGNGNFPCNTIAVGLARAVATGRTKLLVSDGLYSEQVVLVSGKSVLGGYRSDTWERHLSSTATIVRGPEGAGDRKAVVATSITSATVVEGLVINAANATSTGANSYAVYVRDSTSALVMRSNLIFAGLGGPGATGSSGGSGANGVAGSTGRPTFHTNTCNGLSNAGGSGGTKQCQDPGGSTMTTVSGGKGGDSVCPARNLQEGSGSGGTNSGGSGGSGGWGHSSTSSGCNPSSSGPETGVEGSDATVSLANDGAGGGGCSTSIGQVANNEWRAMNGSDGGHGGHGAGGGGGGAGSGGKISDASYDISGSGGGGGSGGCAGSRGSGGVAAGGSFGVFIYWTTGNKPTSSAGVPSITGNVISRNQGGPGGSGGNGGAGGDPGAGAVGGALVTAGLTSPAFCVFGGAKGGFGSRGGHGGGGGGSCGGASFDILAWGINGQQNGFASNTFPNGTSATGGIGGAGGNSSNTNKAGAGGTTGSSGTVMVVD